MDGLIYRTGFDPDRIVSPCGNLQKMQCGTHIVEAGEIRDRVLRENSTASAVCPECGQPLQFHTIRTAGYLEEGYLPQWEKYKLWLSGTLNKKLCVLELGVGFAFPQVIRWPFEKTVLYNQKAFFIRINEQFPQIDETIADRAVSVPENPVSFFNR